MVTIVVRIVVKLVPYSLSLSDIIKGKIQFNPLKFQEIFNLNLKVLKLAVYPPEVSKSGKVNLLLTFLSN
jgi:hypothetical protein